MALPDRTPHRTEHDGDGRAGAAADLVVVGDIVTMDPGRPRAGALAVRDGRITAVGERADAAAWTGPRTEVADIGTGCVLPGFVAAHGHPAAEALMFREGHMVDIRPEIAPTAGEVLGIVRDTVRARAPEASVFVGWDPILHGPALPDADLAWLDRMSPDAPLVILHASGRTAYFNSAAARLAGLHRDSPDPPGGRFARDARGALVGVASEPPAVRRVVNAVAPPADGLPDLGRELRRMNAAGVTTVSEMACLPPWRTALLGPERPAGLTARLYLYELPHADHGVDVAPGTGDDMLRVIGIKIFADGSPLTGTIATSFPYLDTELTRRMGLGERPRPFTSYPWDTLAEMVEAYYPRGWQIACHAHGDLSIDMILDVYESALTRHPPRDHRLRVEHAGAIRADQLARAASLGVSVSMLMDHVYQWGEILTDELFGPTYGASWAPAGSAVRAGVLVTLHNDPPVTLENPLRNVAVAATRRSRRGRVLAPGECLTVHQALRAQTIDAAWQLFADDITGSITPGKYADLVVLSADPYAVPPDDVAELGVVATVLAGSVVHGELVPA